MSHHFLNFLFFIKTVSLVLTKIVGNFNYFYGSSLPYNSIKLVHTYPPIHNYNCRYHNI